MARIKLVEQNEATGAEKERYDELAGRNAVTNMKKGLLNDAATYDAYMAWYTSWNRLVEVIGEKDAILYAHKISTTNSCQLCSLFFISDVKGLGLDPANLVYDEKETLLAQLAEQIVKDPTAVSDELIDSLKKFYRIPWEVFRDMKDHYGRKYIKPEDIEEYEVKFFGYLRFL